MILPATLASRRSSFQDSDRVTEDVRESLVLENDGDPLASQFDKNSLFTETQDGERFLVGPGGNMMLIEDRQDRDAFFDSLGGWN